jgi:hypothetical protein
MNIESYKISARPMLFCEGEHKGSLNGVTFTAASATDTRRWFAINCGQFEEAFIRLMPRSRAKAIVADLLEGEEIELPGLYREEQFDRGFCYEWSPVHWAAPLSIDPIGMCSVSQPESTELQAVLRRNRPVSG